MLDLFGGISTGLAAVLQAGILVYKYFYVEKDEIVKRVSSHHLALLMRRYPKLLPEVGYSRISTGFAIGHYIVGGARPCKS